MIKLLTERQQILDVAETWAKRYPTGHKSGEDKDRIKQELFLLDRKTATSEDVTRIIGNSAWSAPTSCGHCGQSSWNVVQIGEPSDYDSYTAYVCKDCLKEALQLLESEG